MNWTDWLLVSAACAVVLLLWLEAETRMYPSDDDDDNEVDRMVDMGQQPGSWEP